MTRTYKLVDGPLDGSTVDLPFRISVTKFYVHLDDRGEYVEVYHACSIPPDDEMAYKWMGTEKT